MLWLSGRSAAVNCTEGERIAPELTDTRCTLAHRLPRYEAQEGVTTVMARKKDKPPKLRPVSIGRQKTGLVGTSWSRRAIEYYALDHYAGSIKATLDPVKLTATIETAEEASKQVQGGRVGGGLVAGGLLFGPLGAAVGAGIGAAARKQYAQKYLVLTDEDGRSYSAILKGQQDLRSAESLIEGIGKIQAYSEEAGQQR